MSNFPTRQGPAELPLAGQENRAMFNPKDAFEPVEELSTDLWALYGIPDVLVADNCSHFICAMFTEGGAVRLDIVRAIHDDILEVEHQS